MKITPWEVLKSRHLIRNRWVTLRVDSCRTPEGHLVEPYYVFESPDWVHVVPFDPAGRILVVEQYRHGAGTIGYEIPGGIIDGDESPLSAARRELLEETGCAADEFRRLDTLYPNPARQNNRFHTFLALDVKKTMEPRLEASEILQSRFVDLAELFIMIDDGMFSHALHVASLFLALRERGHLSGRR